MDYVFKHFDYLPDNLQHMLFNDYNFDFGIVFANIVEQETGLITTNYRILYAKEKELGLTFSEKLIKRKYKQIFKAINEYKQLIARHEEE